MSATSYRRLIDAETTSCVFWKVLQRKFRDFRATISHSRNEQLHVSEKKLFFKISQYSQENTYVQACDFIKKRLQHKCFPANIVTFLKTKSYVSIIILFIMFLPLFFFCNFTFFSVFLLLSSISTTALPSLSLVSRTQYQRADSRWFKIQNFSRCKSPLTLQCIIMSPDSRLCSAILVRLIFHNPTNYFMNNLPEKSVLFGRAF